MGWLKLGARRETSRASKFPEDLAFTIQKIESISLNSDTLDITKIFHIVALNTPDESLPFIPPEEVKKRTSIKNGALCKSPISFGVLTWHVLVIVIDNIVYDCTHFLKEHPGGEQIIKSFGGAECSWQFWRFHGKKEMEDFGRALRVGRTEGMVNKFKEPQRYVGLKRLGDDEWDW
jgi:hypothetical protein